MELIKFFKPIKNSKFLFSVSTLAFGIIISQFILFASSPLLTRLYDAKDFGYFSVFSSMGAIAAIITTGRYELAILLPETDENAFEGVKLIFLISSCISFFYLLAIFGLSYSFPFLFRKSYFLRSNIIFLIPVYTFFAASLTSLQFWNQRKKRYKQISFSSILQGSSSVLSNIILGLFGIKLFGLIIGLLVGQVVSIVYLLFSLSSFNIKFNFKLEKIKKFGTDFIKFPRFMLGSDLLSTISRQIIPIIFSILFLPEIVGYFALANRMLRVPGIVLTSSIGNVFRNDAIDKIRIEGNCRILYWDTLKKLTIIGLAIFIPLAILSPFVFSKIFGVNWIEAGYFGRLICIMILVDFISTPLNSLFYVFGKMKVYLFLQILNTILGIFLIFVGYWVFKRPIYSILFFAFNSAIFDLVSLSLTYRLSIIGNPDFK